MPPEKTPNKAYQSVTVLILVVVVLLVVAYFMSKAAVQTSPAPANNQAQNSKTGSTSEAKPTKEAVSVKSVDLTKATTDADKLPAGFPTSIPLETNDIFVSTSQTYTDRTPHVTVSTISYRSAKTVAAKYDEYLVYMTNNGYTFSKDGKDAKNHALNGTNGKNTLLVVVSTQSGKTVVQLTNTSTQ